MIEQPLEEEIEPWYKGPIKWILAIFLVMIIILWAIPHYAIKLDPEPKNLPGLEIIPSLNFSLNISHKINAKADFLDYIDPSNSLIKDLADRIVSTSCESSRICQAKALFYFVRDNFEYISDPLNTEYVKTAPETLANKGGDCDDLTILLANLEQAIGIRTRFVFIPGHVYLQINLQEALRKYKEDGWISLDPACSGCDFGEVSYTVNRELREFIE